MMKNNSDHQQINSDKRKKKRKNPRTAVVVYIAALLFLAAAALLGLRLLRMGLVPAKYILLFAVLAVFWAVLLLLLRKKKAGGLLLSLISLIFAGTMFFALAAVNKVDSTLQKVTVSGGDEKSEYSILVPAASPIETGTQLQGLRIACAENMDQALLEQAAARIEEMGGVGCTFAGYDGVFATAEALLSGETEAALIDSAFIPLVDEAIEEGFSDRVRTVLRFTAAESRESGMNAGQDNEEGENGLTQGPFEQEHETDPNRFIVYISGIDTYGSVGVKSRSDVNILAAVNMYTNQVQLINTPRDYFVELPNSDGAKDKLTHGGIYGVEVSIGALEMLYDIDVDYYVRLNFSGFEDIIDALGGVDVYSQYGFRQFSQGYNHLDGESALVFARERKLLPGGDVARGKNQMAVITAVINKMTSKDMLSNYTAVLDSVSGCFQTNMSLDEIYALIKKQLDGGRSWSVESYTVTGANDSAKTFSMPGVYSYVMVPNEDEVREAGELLRAVLDAQ